MQTEPLQLQYESVSQPERRRSPALALVLCFPGLCCWITLVSIVALRVPPGLLDPYVPLMLCSWAAAIITAILSLGLYCRKPRSGLVWMNLVINVTGLLFTVLAALLLIQVR